MSKMIRISQETNDTLNQHFLKKAHKAYEALKKDKKAWEEELAERGEWNVVLEDGLNDE